MAGLLFCFDNGFKTRSLSSLQVNPREREGDDFRGRAKVKDIVTGQSCADTSVSPRKPFDQNRKHSTLVSGERYPPRFEVSRAIGGEGDDRRGDLIIIDIVFPVGVTKSSTRA